MAVLSLDLADPLNEICWNWNRRERPEYARIGGLDFYIDPRDGKIYITATGRHTLVKFTLQLKINSYHLIAFQDDNNNLMKMLIPAIEEMLMPLDVGLIMLGEPKRPLQTKTAPPK